MYPEGDQIKVPSLEHCLQELKIRININFQKKNVNHTLAGTHSKIIYGC